ncbi:MAG TPA: RdgB/HAM1 family non-canonical purine NTP pyrophosphatase [Polyangiaceae bacterium]|nr:RdgB/HAM1 family non-canonical purine NTP pyrophosphatase [Polyangiaceae bacterium]
MTVVLATHNRGKIQELRALLAELPIEVLSIVDVLPQHAMPVEDGATFAENAFIKARDAAIATGLVAIADDSGLEVDALGGRPGVRSARFARENATDAENNAALLTALQEIDETGRTARFRCVIAVVDPYVDLDKPAYFEGRCEGIVARSGRGESGFGYDPLFVVAGTDKTFAEIPDAEKNALSHRGKAARALLPHMRALVESREEEARRVFGRSAG